MQNFVLKLMKEQRSVLSEDYVSAAGSLRSRNSRSVSIKLKAKEALACLKVEQLKEK